MMTNGLEKLRQLRKTVPERVQGTRADDAEMALARPLPPIRTEPQSDDPARRPAKSPPPLTKANGSSLPKMPQSFFDELRAEPAASSAICCAALLLSWCCRC